MSLFLFMKQIVDVLYPYHWLDYLMVIMVIIALIYQILLVRPDVKNNGTLSDVIMLLFTALLTFSFIKNRDAYGIYVKVLSAFLMYFVGRIYYERIKECSGALVSASYIVVYVNFFYRLYCFGTDFLKVSNAEGDLYYYDTDMAFAMILALCFIGMFGRNTLRKYVTIFLVCPYMVLFSDAGIQKIFLAVVVFLMLLYLMEKVTEKRKLANGILLVTVLGLLCMIAVLMLPVVTGRTDRFFDIVTNNRILNAENMYIRYERWREVWLEFTSAGMTEKLFGMELATHIESLYLKTIYAVGIVGLVMFFVFVISVTYYVMKIEDRKTFYITVLLAVMLLGTGATVNSMEATQMSWFPLMFSGMVVSGHKSGRMRGSNG